ncbi:MAG: 50S ribosome-binding GTPase [Negativicutes bacterium]|nr:50S ribosome-binding GTPase [Negativicutes bacterium]
MNKVYAIIGPPASGKSSIVRELRNHGGIAALVSHTTRPPHAGDKEGENYYFVDNAAFSQLRLVEKVSYSGNNYGLSKDEVQGKVNNNPISVVDIDMEGYAQLKKFLSERLESIYILVDRDAILTRSLSQGLNPDVIRKRLDYAESQGEFNNWEIADHVVKNTSSLAVTMRQVLAIMDLVEPKKPNG